MDVQHINVKIFVEKPEALHLENFTTIFNSWIQDRVCEELLVDVADYRHVWAGSGVVLIGHEANYSMDNAGNRLGLLYNRKAIMNGNVQDRWQRVVRSALLACRRLEQDSRLNASIRFNGSEVQLLINDRLLAPNTSDTFMTLKPQLASLLNKMYAHSKYTFEQDSTDNRSRFTVNVQAEKKFDVETLLRNLS